MTFVTGTRRYVQIAAAGAALAATVALGASPVSATAQPALQITGGRTVYTLNEALSGALLNAGVTVTPSGPATASIITRSGAPAIRVTYPVTSGTVAGTGRVRINTAGDTVYTSPSAGTFVDSSPRLIVNPDGTGELTVRIRHQGRVQAATLDFSNAFFVAVDAHVRIANVKFVLNDASAAVYNQFAGTDIFAAGQAVATVNIRVHIA
jgi:hypothetical protein